MNNQQKDSVSIDIVSDQDAIDRIVDAQILIDLGEFDKSITYLELISQNYKGDNKVVEARLLGALARNHLKLELNREAIKLWKNALELVEGDDDQLYLQAVFRNNMSLAYIHLGEAQQARNYLIESLELFPIAQTFQSLSKLALDSEKDFDLSRYYLSSGLAHINDTTVVVRKYVNESYMKNLDQAYIIEGYAYHDFVKGDFEGALQKYKDVLSIAEDINRVSLKIDMLKKIGRLYQNMGDAEKASEYLDRHIRISDSLRVKKNNALSIPVQNILNREESKPKKSSKTIGYAIVLISIISIVLFIMISKNRDEKRRLEQIEKERRDKSISDLNKSKSAPINLSSKTERELLNKLEEFEASGKFLDENISFSILAGYLNSNAKYLRQVLKNNKNTDYNNYINELRIKYIVDKLKTNPDYLNYKISYLAKECGFSSHSKFSADFKRVMNISPSKFINAIKKEGSVKVDEGRR